jgi:hypothetical protein
MVLAFTGTRRGLTRGQLAALGRRLETMRPTVLRNGIAEGADMQMLSVLPRSVKEIHFWPCNRARAKVAGGLRFHPSVRVIVHGILPPIERNHIMVDAADVLIACPHGPEELRSGTWSTVRYARQQGKPVIIVWPDGRVEE